MKHLCLQAINSLGASDLSEVAVIELPAAPPPTPPTLKVDISSEERQAPTIPVIHAKLRRDLREDLTEIVNFVREISMKVQQPWSLQTRRWITAVGVSATLILAFVNL